MALRQGERQALQPYVVWLIGLDAPGEAGEMLQNWREGSSRDLANRLSSQTVRISLVSFA